MRSAPLSRKPSCCHWSSECPQEQHRMLCSSLQWEGGKSVKLLPRSFPALAEIQCGIPPKEKGEGRMRQVNPKLFSVLPGVNTSFSFPQNYH